MNRLVGMTAVITGAASGQGRAAAELFAREGARLALCDRDHAGLARTVDMVASATPDATVVSALVDLASVPEIEAYAATTLAELGVIDVVYNNAGVNLNRAIADTTEADWDLVNAINVRAAFFLVKGLLEGLMRSPAASIINVASGVGFVVPNPGNCMYAASKGALVSLTRAQAIDLAPHGIRVNCISPGLVDTPMYSGFLADKPESSRALLRERSLRRTPIGRFGEAVEIAKVALFLAGADASFITGAIIAADGGFLAG